MSVIMLSVRNIAGVQFSHKTTEKIIVFSQSLSVGSWVAANARYRQVLAQKQ